MSQANVAPGHKVLVHIFSRDAARCVIKVDEHVAAEDDVESPVRPGLGGFYEVYTREVHRLTQIVEDAPGFVILTRVI